MHFLSKKTFYVCSLSVLIAPIIVRKRIQELKLSTYVLFFGVLCLTLLLTVLLGINGTYEHRQEMGIENQSTVNVDTDTNDAKETESGEIILANLVDSLNIAVAS